MSPPLAPPNALVLRGYAAADGGDTRRAVADADLAIETARRASPDVCRWHVVNAAIDIYVNGGCYEKALAAADRWTAEAQARGRAKQPRLRACAAINRAEAPVVRQSDEDELCVGLKALSGLPPVPPELRCVLPAA